MTENNNEGDYELTIEGEGIKVGQSVSKHVALQILGLLMGGNDPTVRNISVLETTTTPEQIDPKSFMAMKKPISDVERITCLAFYLSHFRKVSQYKTRELTDLNVEASQPRFSNASVAARNAVQQQYLSLAGRGKKQITTRGEAVVDALPDRERVKRALEENVFRSIRRKKSKSTAKKES